MKTDLTLSLTLDPNRVNVYRSGNDGIQLTHQDYPETSTFINTNDLLYFLAKLTHKAKEVKWDQEKHPDQSLPPRLESRESLEG